MEAMAVLATAIESSLLDETRNFLIAVVGDEEDIPLFVVVNWIASLESRRESILPSRLRDETNAATEEDGVMSPLYCLVFVATTLELSKCAKDRIVVKKTRAAASVFIRCCLVQLRN
jgi:hypothetical protein